MEENSLIIHCFYDEHGPELQDIIQESFDKYVKEELHIFAIPPKDVLS